MSQSISELVNDLPNRGVTTYVLNALDFVVPGEWDNVTDFEEMTRIITRESDPALINAVIKRADELYADTSNGYQRAMWLYGITDKMDRALGAAAFADKVGERIGFLSFLSRLTPKADTAQTLDFSLKMIIELVSFCAVNGIPGDSIGDFVESLADYSKDSKMRMAALVCLDGLVPLGPDFAERALSTLDRMSTNDLAENDTYQRIKDALPGIDTGDHLAFIGKGMNSVRGWVDGFVGDRELTQEKVVENLQRFIEVSDDKLDYFGAFLDMSTNYYTHTGTQSVARSIIERSVNEI